MPNSSVLLGKRKRHQLLNKQTRGLISPKENNLKRLRTSDTDSNENNNTTEITKVVTAMSTVTTPYLVNNNPDIQLTGSNFPELWINIFSHLKMTHLYELSRVCKMFHNLVQQMPVWNDVLLTSPSLTKQKTSQTKEPSMAIVACKRGQICEGCYKWIIRDGADAVLPMYIFYEHCKLYLCLPCRKIFYKEYGDDIEDNEFEEIYNVHENYITKTIAESDFILSEKDLEPLHAIEVRNPHGRRLPSMILYRYVDIIYAAKLKFGGSVGFLAQLNKRSKKKAYVNDRHEERASQNEKEFARKTILERELAIYGLTIPLGMKKATRYIQRDFGNVQEIVRTIRELDWLNRCTNYEFCLAQYLSVERDSDYPKQEYFIKVDSVKAVTLAKRKALGQWLVDRFRRHQYQPIEVDETNKDLPPIFLWEDIKSMWKTEFINYAISLLPVEVSNTFKNSIKNRHRTTKLAISIIKYHLNRIRIPPSKPLGPTSIEIANTFGKVLRIHFSKSIYEDIAKAI